MHCKLNVTHQHEGTRRYEGKQNCNKIVLHAVDKTATHYARSTTAETAQHPPSNRPLACGPPRLTPPLRRRHSHVPTTKAVGGIYLRSRLRFTHMLATRSEARHASTDMHTPDVRTARHPGHHDPGGTKYLRHMT